MMKFWSMMMFAVLVLAGCAVDTASYPGPEPTGVTQQPWQGSWQAVGGTFQPELNSTINTFADGTGVHMVGASTSNKIWYQRTATDGVTVSVAWAEIPGQTTTSQYTPVIVRGLRVLSSRDPYIVFRVVTSTGRVEYTTLNHYLLGDTWSWTGSWTAITQVPTGVSHPVGAAYADSISQKNTGRVFLFYIGASDSQPYMVYSNDNAATWSSPSLIGGGQANYLTAVNHYTGANAHVIELVRRNLNGTTHSWNRLQNPDSSPPNNWRGWQAIPGDKTSLADIGMSTVKSYNFCVYTAEENYNNVWQNCTTYGSGGDSSTFAASWTQIPTISAYWGVGAASYCTSLDSVPEICTNGQTKEYAYVSLGSNPAALWMQYELK